MFCEVNTGLFYLKMPPLGSSRVATISRPLADEKDDHRPEAWK
jgi:hypothetical protein